VYTEVKMRVLEQETILVTGATDGLGKRVASKLAQRGATVLLHGRNRGLDGMRETHADWQAYDEVAGKRLWDLSEDLCGSFLEPIDSRR
jgi:NAD(P)-dependent dehydrogenase (short-subunit alcohol dehydrogenase family)